MFTNIPEASALLYRYTSGFSRGDPEPTDFVGSAFVYQDQTGILFVRAR